jgi:heptaprenylglyceryl phosphate synthase
MDEKQLKHRYWVAFQVNTGGGACEINLALPIRSGADVAVVGDLIRQNAGITGQVVVTGWTKFEDA